MMDTAGEMDFNGIEVYNIHKFESLTGKGGPFHKYNTQATARELKRRHLAIPVFDTSVDISDKADPTPVLKELIDTAYNMYVEYIGVTAQFDDEVRVRKNLDALLPYAAEKKVGILIKTTGIYADTARLRALMDSYASDYLAALWDVHHPCRDWGESAADTIKNLGAYVKHVHMRDSDNESNYNLIGEGSLPIEDFMRALSSIDYDGFISMEWKRGWMEDVTDLEIIFPYLSTTCTGSKIPGARRNPCISTMTAPASMYGKKTS